MRKYIRGLLITFIFIVAGHAQAQQKGSLWFSAIAGLNSTLILNQNTYGNPEMPYMPTFGLTGGIGAVYFNNHDWGISGTMLVSKLGQNYKGEQAGGEAKRKVKLYYVEVPLLLMKKISGIKKPLWISIGPDLLFLLKAQQDYSRDGGTPLPNPEGMASGDIRERFRTTDIAVNFSVSRSYALDRAESKLLFISLNSALGITDINEAEWQFPNVYSEYGKSHNFYIGAKVALMIIGGRFGGRSW
jgi:hypothetical protein